MAQEPVNARQRLVGELDSSYEAMMEVVRALPSPSPTPGGWGPFEVLCHMIGWHRYSAERLREIAAGGTGWRQVDTDALNESFVREHATLTSAELLEGLGRSFNEMRDAALAVPDKEFWVGPPGEEDSLAYFVLNANGPEHYAEHIEELKAAVP